MPPSPRPPGASARAYAAVCLLAACASAPAASGSRVARPDAYCVAPGETLTVAAGGLLANDGALRTVVRSTMPARGELVVRPDGSFTFTPADGATGEERFTYAATDAVEVFRAPRSPIPGPGGALVDGAAFGSAWTAVPGAAGEFYGLTDRGPNADGPVDDSKVFARPGFQPAIGRFVLADGALRQVGVVGLRDAQGLPLTGLVPPQDAGATGEVAFDLTGAALPPDPRGIDPEGLVALADGTFWVADEYGPTLTHFAADGVTLERLTPFAPDARGRQLPRVLARRAPNRGLEGLTITPDGSTLIGVMQSALANEIGERAAKKAAPVRIVTVALATGATRQHLYLLDEPGAVVSEIAAVSATELLVLERDGEFPGAGARLKRIYRCSLAGASDVGVAGAPGEVLDPARGRVLGGGVTIEAVTAGLGAGAAASALAARGVVPVTKTLELDLLALFEALDPSGRFFAHDKLEGLAVVGARLAIANDSDFGIDVTRPPSHAIAPKTVPTTGEPDVFEVLVVDRARLPVVISTADVTLTISLACSRASGGARERAPGGLSARRCLRARNAHVTRGSSSCNMCQGPDTYFARWELSRGR